ncbi:MAG TPA: tripartite tricarboxylate transporter permease, partial [Thermodesulfobacteriota bacterium]
LLILSRISGGSFAAGVFPMAIGLALSTVGEEPVTAQNRFTFGVNDLRQGVEIAALVVGLYGLAEIMSVVEELERRPKPLGVSLREMLPTRDEIRRALAPYGRGTVLGFIFGLLPGPSATLSSFASYRLEKAVSRYRHEIGHGAIEGVAGPETSNNAAATSSMAPLLALGIPFGASTALMLAALMVHGVQPGPLLLSNHPEVFWGVIASLLIGNVVLLFLNIPLIGVWVSLLRIPYHVFLPVILILTAIGSYSVRNSMLDVYVFLLLGCIGYVLRKFDFELAPLVVGFVLGPLIEKHMREALFMSLGDVSVFYESPIAVGIWASVLLILAFGAQRAMFRRLLGMYRNRTTPGNAG